LLSYLAPTSQEVHHVPFRRALLGASGFAALPGLPSDWAVRPARAQAERVIRYGISMADIPHTTGQPDRGAGAYQFTGHTLYDPLVAWEMDVAGRPGKLVPGLATELEGQRRRTAPNVVFRLREGVQLPRRQRLRRRCRWCGTSRRC
jgi:peptide/nickel transport system substrate-binding protein